MADEKHDPVPPLRPDADRLFDEYLSLRRENEAESFDSWVRGFPEHEADLRRALSDWRKGMEVLERDAPAFLGASLAPGSEIGDFRLVSRLGRGAQGTVWEARQVSLNRRVALKLFLSRDADQRTITLFEREAKAGGRLAHPGIVTTYAHGESSGVFWIAQELVPRGLSLRDLIEETRQSPAIPSGHYRKTAELVTAVAEALHEAHEAGVIHRDVKPANILITPQGHPKVTDFGLARVRDATALSESGDVIGTYLYMSPEQVSGRRGRTDHRTDVFSLGVVLYELLTLTRPFEGDTTQQICSEILNTDPPDPRRIRSQCPRDLAVICAKAMEKDPRSRYATMADFAADLERHLSHQPIVARPPGRLTKATKWVQRNPYKALSGSVATAAFLVIFGLLLVLDTRRVEAKELTANVFRLSAFQKLDDLTREAERLWPPSPEHLAAYDAWLDTARELVGGLESQRAQLTKLETLALPYSQEDREADRRSHARFDELERLRARLAAMKRAQAVRDGETEIEEVRLDEETLRTNASGLIDQARRLVDPHRKRFGDEARGLALARLALERVEDDDEAALAGETLAWAHYANGSDAEALSEMQATVGAAPEPLRGELERALSSLRVALAQNSLAALGELSREVAALEAEVSARRTWRFPSEEQRWWHTQLTKLVRDIEDFAYAETGLRRGTSPEHGWGIQRRRAFAAQVEEGTITGAEVAAKWAKAVERVASNERYAGLTLTPQLGLVPLGPDPVSRLEEFGHPLSGGVPSRDDEGRLVLGEDTGLVFVLLPGGRFMMGAQSGDESRPSYDPESTSDEGPPHPVILSPFFISKYEMTQGQWMHLTDSNPSMYEPSSSTFSISLLHPVEQVSWHDCEVVCRRMGLSLPTEAQWEYAARAGTTSVWWTGDDRESLRERAAANLADGSSLEAGAYFPEAYDWSELKDGYAVHAPVDALAANGFGLHHVHGNLWEWCMDVMDDGYYTRSPLHDPISSAGPPSRVCRGGGFYGSSTMARSAYRDANRPEFSFYALGLRPARALR